MRASGAAGLRLFGELMTKVISKPHTRHSGKGLDDKCTAGTALKKPKWDEINLLIISS